MPQEESVLLDINDRVGTVTAGFHVASRRPAHLKFVACAIALVMAAVVTFSASAKSDRFEGIFG